MTLEAAMMKSRISMVAPGRPMLKNLGLQCFMMVFTMSCKAQQAHSAPRPLPPDADFSLSRWPLYLVLVQQPLVHDVVEVHEKVCVW